MAKGRSRRRGNGASGAELSDADRIIEAAMARIADDGWRRVSLAAIAEAAGLPILRVYRTFPSKSAILCGFTRRIDEAVLAAPVEVAPDERPRDRIFDLLMRRFDALQPYKPALVRLRRELPFDPPAALATGAGLLHSIAWMLEAAGISTTGIGGLIAVKLTAGAYFMTQRVWIGDDSPDLAPTMAELDRRLRAIERWLASGGRNRRETPANG
jgi:AcrR family transcriptional regulator